MFTRKNLLYLDEQSIFTADQSQEIVCSSISFFSFAIVEYNFVCNPFECNGGSSSTEFSFCMHSNIQEETWKVHQVLNCMHVHAHIHTGMHACRGWRANLVRGLNFPHFTTRSRFQFVLRVNKFFFPPTKGHQSTLPLTAEMRREACRRPEPAHTVSQDSDQKGTIPATPRNRPRLVPVCPRMEKLKPQPIKNILV